MLMITAMLLGKPTKQHKPRTTAGAIFSEPTAVLLDVELKPDPAIIKFGCLENASDSSFISNKMTYDCLKNRGYIDTSHI